MASLGPVKHKQKAQSTPCAYCGDCESQVQACSRCKLVSYCSKECQKADWKKENGHKTSCIPVGDQQRKPTNIPGRLTTPNNICCICLDEVSVEDWKLPCSHIFHEACIKDMMLKNENLQSCPNCRTPLPPMENEDALTFEQAILAMRSLYRMQDESGYNCSSVKPGHTCTFCGKIKATMPCPKCSFTVYCNQNCRLKDLKDHKDMCKKIRNNELTRNNIVGTYKTKAITHAVEGNRYRNLEQYDKAIVQYRKALKCDKSLYGTRLDLATVLRTQLGDIQGAIILNKENIKIFKTLRKEGHVLNLPENHNYESFLALLFSETADSIDHFGSVLALKNEGEKAVAYFQNACEFYQEALRIYPNTYCDNYSNCLIRCGKPSEAMDIRKYAVEMKPNEYICNYNYAQSLKTHTLEYGEAAKYFEKSSKCPQGSEDADTFYNCSECCALQALIINKKIISIQKELEKNNADLAFLEENDECKENEKEVFRLMCLATETFEKGQALDPRHAACGRIKTMLMILKGATGQLN